MGGSGRLVCCVCVWWTVPQASSGELFFTRWCANLIQLRWPSLLFSDVKFRQDSIHQKLLKSVHFCRVIQNIKGGIFETHMAEPEAERTVSCNPFIGLTYYVQGGQKSKPLSSIIIKSY